MEPNNGGILKNPWLNFDFEIAQSLNYFVHDLDKSFVDAYNYKKRNVKNHLLTHMLPEPWVGRLDAPVVVLQANPGASQSEVNPKWSPPTHQSDCARRTLSQEEITFPLYWLDPKLQETDGHKWSVSNLKNLISTTNLESVANKVLLIETHAYHSQDFDSAVKGLATQEFTKQILRDAIARKAEIVVLRQRKYWMNEVPELELYEKSGGVHFGVNARRAYISPGNLGGAFEKIVQKIKS